MKRYFTKAINNNYFILKGLVNNTEDTFNITLGRQQNSSGTIKLWDGEEQHEAVINKKFKLISNPICRNAIFLQPEEEELDNFRVLANGSLFFTSPNSSENERILGPENYCIIPTVSFTIKKKILIL